jgi:tetratricopeptide (TPR) repeat protein/pimeloyl-ACP methyl ester carboxylesterase
MAFESVLLKQQAVAACAALLFFLPITTAAAGLDELRKSARATFASHDDAHSTAAFELLLAKAHAEKSDLDELYALASLGDIARRNGKTKQAADYYHRALLIAGNGGELSRFRADLANREGEALYAVRDLNGAFSVHKEALKTANETGNQLEAAIAARSLGVINSEWGDISGAREMLGAAVAASDKLPNDDHDAITNKLKSLQAWASVEFDAGRMEEADKLARQVVQLAQKAGSQAEVADAQVTLGMVADAKNDSNAARTQFTAALTYLRTANNPASLGSALQGLARVEVNAKNFAVARKLAEDAQIEARKTGYAINEAQAMQMIAHIDRQMGDKKGSIEAMQKVVDIFRSEGDIPRLAIALVSLGSFERSTDTTAARQAYLEAYAFAKDKGQRCPFVKAAVGLGNLELPKLPARAEPYFAEALVGAQMQSDKCGTARAHLGMGEVKLLQNKIAEAERHMQEALRLFENEKDDGGLGDTLIGLGKLEESRDQPLAARTNYSAAVEAFRRDQDSAQQEEAENLAANVSLGPLQHAKLHPWITGGVIAFLLAAGFALAALRWRTTRAGSASRGEWFQDANAETVFVFVHGILSDSKTCWTAPNGSYWPAIVRDDARFGAPDIYLGGYYTAVGSGIFGVDDAASKLMSDLRTIDANQRPGSLSRKKIVFVAHSTGGLVVRYLLERYAAQFADKKVGLVLVASPSRGSDWANRLSLLHRTFGNRMGGQLERDQDLVRDLDQRFADMVRDGRIPKLQGIDMFENHFIVRFLGLFNRSQVVRASDSSSYFGAYRIVPNTDHFSIAKPDSAHHASHQYLWEFYSVSAVPWGA